MGDATGGGEKTEGGNRKRIAAARDEVFCIVPSSVSTFPAATRFFQLLLLHLLVPVILVAVVLVLVTDFLVLLVLVVVLIVLVTFFFHLWLLSLLELRGNPGCSSRFQWRNSVLIRANE